jgi:hypothetical protein
MTQDFQSCIEACSNCAVICDMCSSACLKEDGCEDDGSLYPARHGLRSDLPYGGSIHGAWQRTCF